MVEVIYFPYEQENMMRVKKSIEPANVTETEWYLSLEVVDSVISDRYRFLLQEAPYVSQSLVGSGFKFRAVCSPFHDRAVPVYPVLGDSKYTRYNKATLVYRTYPEAVAAWQGIELTLNEYVRSQVIYRDFMSDYEDQAVFAL